MRRPPSSRSRVPARTCRSPGTRSSTQCAAVSTHRGAITVPPQNCLKPAPLLPSRACDSMSATCQGHDPALASSPPTIRENSSEAARELDSSAATGAPNASIGSSASSTARRARGVRGSDARARPSGIGGCGRSPAPRRTNGVSALVHHPGSSRHPCRPRAPLHVSDRLPRATRAIPGVRSFERWTGLVSDVERCPWFVSSWNGEEALDSGPPSIGLGGGLGQQLRGQARGRPAVQCIEPGVQRAEGGLPRRPPRRGPRRGVV